METVNIECAAGEIIGQLDHQHGVITCKGIPYAEPPIGSLRWRPPVPAATFERPFDASSFCAACAQQSSVIFGPIGRTSEQCLALNIWCPADRSRRKAVMVWMHGGGFTTGNSASPIYFGHLLAQLDVVVVSINYRLGPFGFFAHPALSQESEHNVSGNYGLLDQWCALKWIQANIIAFGGDPGCVTLFGESAGASSILRHLVSPLSRGLFHRAVMQSQGPITPHRHLKSDVRRQTAMEASGLVLTQNLGLNDQTAIDELRQRTPAEILELTQPAQGPFASGERYAPVIDDWMLPDDPLKLIEQGKWHRMPVMLGTNRDEGTIFVPQIPHTSESEYQQFLNNILWSSGLAEQAANKWSAEATSRSFRELIAAWISAVTFDYPVEQIVRAILTDRDQQEHRSTTEVFRYAFERVPGTEMAKRAGCFHSLEIGYVFGTILRAPKGYDQTDHDLARQMMRRWVTFARTGSPDDVEKPNLKWNAIDNASRQHVLRLGDHVYADELSANEMVRFALDHTI